MARDGDRMTWQQILDALVETRRRNNLTTVEVAERMICSRNAVHMFEMRVRRREHIPRLDLVVRYADAVGAKLVVRVREPV